MTPAVSYLAVLDDLVSRENGHDALEFAAFDAADRDLCERINTALGDRVEQLRQLRIDLHRLHGAWKCRRAGLVADSPAMLAGAITSREAMEALGRAA